MMFATLSCSISSVTVAAADGTLFLDLLPWLLALLVIVVIGGVFMYAAKRLLQSHVDSVPEGFTLQSLRDLHAAGQLSDEEFTKAKAAMIGQVTKTKEADNEKADKREIAKDETADKSRTESGTGRVEDGPISS